MVNIALDSVSADIITRAFVCCGIAENGTVVEREKLNQKLKVLLEAGEMDALTQASSHRTVLQGIEEEQDSDEDTSDTELVECDTAGDDESDSSSDSESDSD